MDTITIDIQTKEKITVQSKGLEHGSYVLLLAIGETTSRVAFYFDNWEDIRDLGQRITNSAQRKE